MERVESQEAGFPPFPHSLEIPSGFPHSHGLGCWHISRCKSMRDRSQGLLDLKGLVTDVSGPQRNACPGTLTPERTSHFRYKTDRRHGLQRSATATIPQHWVTHEDGVCPGKRVESCINVCSSCRVIR